MTEYEALKLVSEHDGESYSAILDAARDAGFVDDLQNRMRFDLLRECGYIGGDGLTCIRISPLGIDRLKQYEKDEHKEKAERYQKIWNNVFAVVKVLPLSKIAAFRTVIDFACVRAPAFFAALWNRIKDWIK